jgi:hypothetical protein
MCAVLREVASTSHHPNGTNDDDVVLVFGDANGVTAFILADGAIQLTADGGDGDDVLLGGPGLDSLDGGPDNNILIQD